MSQTLGPKTRARAQRILDREARRLLREEMRPETHSVPTIPRPREASDGDADK